MQWVWLRPLAAEETDGWRERSREPRHAGHRDGSEPQPPSSAASALGGRAFPADRMACPSAAFLPEAEDPYHPKGCPVITLPSHSCLHAAARGTGQTETRPPSPLLKTPMAPLLRRTSPGRPHGPHPPPIQAHLCGNPSTPLAHVQDALDLACPLPPPGHDPHVHVPCWTHLPLCLWVSAPSNLAPHHRPDPKAGLGVLGGPPWEGKLHQSRAGLV